MNIPLTPVRFLGYAEQQFPGKTAVVCGDQRFTYAQFAERASRLAGALREAGVQPGDRIAFLSLNCHRLLEAYYGVLEAGAVLLPLNFRLAPDQFAPAPAQARRGAILRTDFPNLKAEQPFHLV
jgi:fatty-acyl-CoA synthase